ncbi:MAG TPA: alanine racemase, partial [Pyrinomonadaceae bacterium]|nr:alanine racemase [Pyrinomonadaceae bacterium]
MAQNGAGNLGGHRPTRAEIDLDALAANYRTVRGAVGQQVRIMSVVKANAYGHGAIACARRLVGAGTDWLAVALPEEGLALRAAGIEVPILVLGGFWPGQESLCLAHRLVPVIY